MLAALNLQYGSDIGIEFAVEVQKTLAIEAYRSSVFLAKERGPFPMYDSQREKNNPFINRIKNEDAELYSDMVKYGRRNIALLTIAPTGTTSLMTQTTSGIEPVFMPIYKRRRKVNPNDKNVKITFTDEVGDSWEEFNVYHHKFLTWLEVNGYDTGEIESYGEEELSKLVEKSPYYKSTSKDVDWVSKVKMQGMIQKWVDHSISVTVNLPTDITEEMVAKVYQTAWESGCKGCTVYREGSRDGVLISATKKEDQSETAHPAIRPQELECDVIRFKNNSENWIAFVGLYNGKPYEIFTGISEDDVLPIPKTVKKGKILKIKEEEGSRYDFQYVDRFGYTNTVGGLSHMFNKEFWNYAKLISGVLRNGMPIPDVVNLVSSLRLDNETINTWNAGVERALRRYIPNGTKAKKGVRCDCGSDALVYQEGCLICTNCGNSKCG
jgi:ribonucleoside-diphosphate reductase alpha chain